MKPRIFASSFFLIILLIPGVGYTQWIQDGTLNKNSAYSFAENGTNLFAGTSGGLFFSNDSGASWTLRSPNLIYTGVKSLAISGTNLVIGTSLGVFHSTDNGESWAIDSAGLPPMNYIRALAMKGMSFFLGTDEGIFRSSDTGTIWTTTGYSDTSIFSLGSVSSLWASGMNFYAGTADGVIISTDNGLNWRITSAGLPETIIRAFATLGSNLFAGADGGGNNGVFRSLDTGKSWFSASVGLSNAAIQAFAVSGNNVFAGTSSAGIFLSTDFGASWISVNSGLGDSGIYSLFAIGNNLFAGTRDSGVWRRPLSEMIGTNAVASSPLPVHTLTAFPNPSTQSATISVTSAESSEADITIVNLLGEEVERLFEGTMEYGAHTFTWDGRGVAPGVYECVARVGGSVERVRVVLLR